MAVSLPLIIPNIEPYAIHFLIVISNLADFQQQSNVNSFETSLVHTFNGVINSYLGYHRPREASTAQVLKVETGVNQTGDIYDVMVVFTDTYGEQIYENTVYEEVFAGREGQTGDDTGYRILAVSKTDFSRDNCEGADNEDDKEEASVWRIVALVFISLCVLLMLICYVQCCRECFCGEKRNVMPTSTFDNSNLTVDLERGRVRQLSSADQPSSSSSRQESIMSSVSRRPLVNTEELYVAEHEFKFIPMTRNNHLHVPGNESNFEQYFQESEILSLATDVCEPSPVIAKDVNADIINGYSNRKVDFQRTGSFPRSRKLTLYEKSLIHEAALPPLEETQSKGAPLVTKSSSLQNLVKIVDASKSIEIGKTNPAFVNDYNQEEADTVSLFENVEDLDRPKPSFDESIAAFQNLEGRAACDYTRTLPSKMRRVHSLTEISAELNKNHIDGSKRMDDKYASVEQKKSSSIGNFLEEKSFFSRFFS